MSKVVDKIISKHGLKPICQRTIVSYNSRKYCPEGVKRLKEWREAYISDFIASKSKDSSYIENILSKVARSEVSRVYNSVRDSAKVEHEVLWGNGGHQTKRARELNEKGVSFIWIENINE